MALLDQMRDKLSQASQTTMQKAKEISDLARLNNQISAAEAKITELYGKIGYEIYCAYRESPPAEAAALMEEVTQLHGTIRSCRAQIMAINSAGTCPQCGAKTGRGMTFCSSCGYRLQPESPPTGSQGRFCRYCGAPISEDAAFCTACGKKAEDA